MAKQNKQPIKAEVEQDQTKKDASIVEKNAIVIKAFSDQFDFSIKYEIGNIVNHFSKDRLDAAVLKGVVEIK